MLEELNNINKLKEKLLTSSAKSIFSNAHPKKSVDKIDLLELLSHYNHPDLTPAKTFEFLLKNESFKFLFNVQYGQNKRHPLKRKLLNIYRKNTDAINELSIDCFGVGYPLIRIPDQGKRRLRYIPIFIWDLKISKSKDRLNYLFVKKEKSPNVYINPILIETIKLEFNEFFVDPTLLYENKVHENYLSIVNIFLSALELNPIEDDFIHQSAVTFQNDELVYSSESNSALINNGVLGLYDNSKSPIIKDYNSINDLYFFKQKKDVSINLNETIFCGVDLDHSQQKVIKSLNSGKDIVIHGPPGTGKSKTLTGVLLHALSKGSSCLVICEKKTAMDVIFKNLSELGFSEYCIKIDDVRKDRRMVVDKAREIVEEQSASRTNLFKENKINITSSAKKIIDDKIVVINSMINEIYDKKQKLNAQLLEPDLNYTDLVLSIDIEKKNEMGAYGISRNQFKFEPEEYIRLSLLFNNIKTFIDKHSNPYDSFFNYINFDFINAMNAEEYGSYIENIYLEFHESLLSLKKLILEQSSNSSAINLKYYDILTDENSSFSLIIKRFKQLRSKLFRGSLFNKNFVKLVQNMDLIAQLDFLSKAVFALHNGKSNLDFLVGFNSIYTTFPAEEKLLVDNYCQVKGFEEIFNNWYFRVVVNQNYVGNFDFNGFQKGYYDIVGDIDLINDFLRKETLFNLFNKRLKAIIQFKNTSKSLTIEQFFSKKSTAKNKKLTLREISSNKSKLFQSFFPIILTNPSTCSTIFPMENESFDLVIFDEASQLRVEDNFPALLRGKQRVVAGDLNQLPPMNYFKKTNIELERNTSSYFNSLLDFCINKNFKEHYLDIHYRSKHPDLIAFSNHAFYESRLIPLPPTTKETPIIYNESNGVFKDGVNKKEALDIVSYLNESVKDHFSIGIATFNLAQKDEILDQIQIKCIEDKSFFDKMEIFNSNGFFVKNLENIQGEERDVIIISCTYGINDEGYFRQAFGPVNSHLKGFKLLNVIITRSIHQMVVFSSIPASFIKDGFEPLNSFSNNRGKAVFYGFLAYVKAVSKNKINEKEAILKLLSRNSEVFQENKKSDLVLIKFTNKLIDKINTELKSSFRFENNFSLGGFTYEIILKNKDVKILIDLNGKLLHGDYEDYIFDINRSKIAVKSGYKYYRLWTSNLFNNFDQEVYKLINFILLN